ncbi:beta strand repeat-containing protein [Psychrobacter sp.]|uniref:beta strand repeat-containing protein n=1 Tax=Psychrobacter sp. TaxID=56811 RepID=UPI003568168D
MKSNNFNYSLLAVGVAAVMGISTGAMAATATDTTKAAGAINNVATASYSVGTVVQPTVTSNTVTVNVNETANFSLIATIVDNDNNNNTNSNQAATLGGTNTFTHSLSNTGNVTDTYTVRALASDDATLVTASQNYLFKANNDSIAFVIKRTSDGTALTLAEGQALGLTVVAGNITSGGTIKLAPGLTADLSYQVPVPSANQIGGQIGVGTLTASSAFIGTGTILTNENQSIVRLPVFSIVKRVTKTLDLSNPTDEATYTITVKNNKDSAYATDATNVKIIDSLPAGLKLVSGSIVTTVDNSGLLVPSGTKGTIGNTATTSSNGTSNAIDSFEIGNVNLPVGAIVTVTFRVLQDDLETLASPLINHAHVEAPVGNVTIKDSTENGGANENTATYYPAGDDVENINGSNPTGTGGDSTQPLLTVKRALALSNPTVREISPASGSTSQATHTTIITNTGRDTEGTDANPLNFTIADDSLNTAVRPVIGPVSITYTPASSTTSITRSISPTTTSGNTYSLNGTTLPDGGIPNGGTFTISYNVSSGNVTNPKDATTAAALGSSENTIVTLTPTGTGAPTATTVTDKTNVKGLTLEKFQALDATCTGAFSAAVFSKDAITGAKPDQCIIYRINATNTSSAIQTADSKAASGFNITGLTITDLLSNFSAGADYVSGTAASSATTSSSIGDATANATAITAAMSGTDVLAPQGTASLSFKVKIKNARTTTP